MLVLRVKEGQTVDINGPCRIKFVKSKGARGAEWGFDMPDTTKVLREGLQPKPDNDKSDNDINSAN